MKKVLFFMPDNALKKNAGNKIRALSFLHYFKSRGIQVHYVSEYFWGNWNKEDISEFKASHLSTETHIIYRKPVKKNLLSYFFFYKLPEFFYEKKWGILPVSFPEMVTYRLRKSFNKILSKNTYDYIFVNYASWSGLIDKNPLVKNAITMLDTHDFLTAQYKNKFDIGKAFKEEIRRLSIFNHVLTISAEEQYVFDQFSKSDVRLAPMMIETPHYQLIPFENKNFDLIYVASKNPHNVASFNWFMSEVYPLLPNTISICVIGQITAYLPENLPNVTSIPFAEQLNSYYENARVAICPMRSGTGTKIKVIEALSYGLPIVCNSRGVDGLLNKKNNGCMVSDSPAGFAEHILRLLNDTKKYEEQSLFARQTFASSYSQEACYRDLDVLFNIGNHES